MARRNKDKKKCERAREVEVAQHLTLAKGASPSFQPKNDIRFQLLCKQNTRLRYSVSNISDNFVSITHDATNNIPA